MAYYLRLEKPAPFLTAPVAVYNLFNLGRHLIRAEHYRNLRICAFSEWSKAAA